MREMINMVVVLTALTAISGALLSAVYKGTAIKIEEQVLKYDQAPAIMDIFPKEEITNDPIADRFKIEKEDQVFTIFPAKLQDGGKAICLETKDGGGYGGDIGLMVGINIENDQVVAVRVTVSAETKGYGSKAKEEPDFVSQFADQPINTNFALKANGGVIDAISGATVTSDALAKAALKAQELYKELKPEIEKNFQ